MEKVPVIKELVDHYSGPDRVTAKKQQEELERVAKTLPQSAPASVKRFTDRAILSLQVGVLCNASIFTPGVGGFVAPLLDMWYLLWSTTKMGAIGSIATQAGDLIGNASLWISWCGRSHSITSKLWYGSFLSIADRSGSGFTILIIEGGCHRGFQVLLLVY
ncbi:hypothetical protein TEA_007828 [Camellia sinensis var. sinensis]|uniref:Uncharacterized protein n=1 Tax=Camellia sinensis var. sinensis TaxID=542762 RepID=A0A4S4ED00_CAMSN|nr:hypothetical protein TEA_007828 [Camellia sinensis var. sinensis]